MTKESQLFGFQITKGELARYRKIAKRNHMSLSEYFRTSAAKEAANTYDVRGNRKDLRIRANHTRLGSSVRNGRKVAS